MKFMGSGYSRRISRSIDRFLWTGQKHMRELERQGNNVQGPKGEGVGGEKAVTSTQ